MPDSGIDMDELLAAWEDESPDHSYYLDLQSGNIEMVQPGLLELDELRHQIESDRQRYLYVPRPSSAVMREDLAEYIQTVADPALRRLMDVVLEAPNADFSFRQIVAKHQEASERWRIFRQGRNRLRIDRWLRANLVFSDQSSDRSNNLSFEP